MAVFCNAQNNLQDSLAKYGLKIVLHHSTEGQKISYRGTKVFIPKDKSFHTDFMQIRVTFQRVLKYRKIIKFVCTCTQNVILYVGWVGRSRVRRRIRF